MICYTVSALWARNGPLSSGPARKSSSRRLPEWEDADWKPEPEPHLHDAEMQDRQWCMALRNRWATSIDRAQAHAARFGVPLPIKTWFWGFSESLLFFVQFKNIFSHHKVKNFFVCDGWPQSFPNEINIEILYIVLLNYSSEWFNWISPPQARKILRFCLPKTCFAL